MTLTHLFERLVGLSGRFRCAGVASALILIANVVFWVGPTLAQIRPATNSDNPLYQASGYYLSSHDRIIGEKEDSKNGVPANGSYPASAIGALSFLQDGPLNCTVWLVAPRLAATALHCLARIGRLNSDHFYIGFGEGTAAANPHQRYRVKLLFDQSSMKSMESNSANPKDWALLELPVDLGNKYGWIGIVDSSERMLPGSTKPGSLRYPNVVRKECGAEQTTENGQPVLWNPLAKVRQENEGSLEKDYDRTTDEATVDLDNARMLCGFHFPSVYPEFDIEKRIDIVVKNDLLAPTMIFSSRCAILGTYRGLLVTDCGVWNGSSGSPVLYFDKKFGPLAIGLFSFHEAYVYEVRHFPSYPIEGDEEMHYTGLVPVDRFFDRIVAERTRLEGKAPKIVRFPHPPPGQGSE